MVLPLISLIIPILQSLPKFAVNIYSLLSRHGYIGIIVLLILEYASLPVPSEVVIPLIGLFVYRGTLNLYLALGAIMIGTVIGITIDYYIAYFLGRDIIYTNAAKLRIKREQLIQFETWFNNNAGFTVFVARLIPVIRGLISFPAGFARMDLKKFYLYSICGSLIWNTALLVFGYYTLGSTNFNLVLIFAGVGLFAQLLYIIYFISMRKIKDDNRRKSLRERNSY